MNGLVPEIWRFINACNNNNNNKTKERPQELQIDVTVTKHLQSSHENINKKAREDI